MKAKVFFVVLVLLLVTWIKVSAYGISNPGMPKSFPVTVGENEQHVIISKGMNCWTTRLSGRIGNFYGRWVIKFATNQQPIKMKYVQCEGSTDLTSERRALWTKSYYRFHYQWKVIGSNFQTITAIAYNPFEKFEVTDIDNEETRVIRKGTICTGAPEGIASPGLGFPGVVKFGDRIVDSNSVLLIFETTIKIKLKNVRCWEFKDSENRIIGNFIDISSLKKTFQGWGYKKLVLWNIKGINEFVTSTPVNNPKPTISSTYEFPNNESVTLLKPKIGDICWGTEIASYKFTIIEFTQNLNYSIPVKRGGCITNGLYTSQQVQNYLETRGLFYQIEDFPKIPTVTRTPSITRTYTVTRTPTLTLIPRLNVDWATGNQAWYNPSKGVICWGQEIAGRKFHVVEFTEDISAAVLLKNCFCTFSSRYTVRDVYNYLVRNGRRIDAISKFP